MASNSYNPYNYPDQQSSAQQYAAYQTAPAPSNAAQPSRQYQQPPTTQGSDYMSYQVQPYGGQTAGYGTAQDSSWNGSSYTGGNRETTSRAAEVLRILSSTPYASKSTVTSQPGFTAANTATSQSARYATGSSNSPRMQTQQTHATQAPYGQSQAQPSSVNANRAQQSTSRGLPTPATAAGYPAQRAQTIYNQQQQRSASPAQHSYNSNSATATQSSRTPAMAAATSQQYTDHDRRQLASVEASRSSQSAAAPPTYNYGSTSTVAPPGLIAPPPSTMSEPYNGQGSITVDPTAVYDPWPEYKRKQEALNKERVIEAARKEEERIVEEACKAEEAKKEEERKRQEAVLAGSQPKQKAKKAQKQQAAAEPVAPAPAEAAGPAEALEAEIRAMMAKLRELNSKDPALLARIWEEERRVMAAPKSPTVQSKPTGQAAVPAPAPANTPQAANQREKAALKEAPSASTAKPATPVPAWAVAVRSPAAPRSTRPSGNTHWPPEKKAQLSSAAAAYLNSQNPGNQMEPARVLAMLNGNPSYIELCEQLEAVGFKLGRAAFAKNLLNAVPDVNSMGRKAAPQPAPVHRPPPPPAVMKKEIATPSAASPHAGFTPAAATPANRASYPPFPDNASPAATPAPVAEMIPIRPGLKPPANKEEAARKRNLSDLVDLTLLDEEEEMGPPPKRINNADPTYACGSLHPHMEEDMIVDSEPAVNNFPIAAVPTRAPEPMQQAGPPPMSEIRYRAVVEPLDKKKALRRNNYNPATIARDVLLACGRHPSERQLNQHLDALRANLPHIALESDLSTIKWDVLDPGRPPPGYFKDSVQALAEDEDDEDDSEDDGEARPRAHSTAIGSESGAARVQALPEAINPFNKQKKRGRPPAERQSLPATTTPATPKRSPSAPNMSASAPRPGAAGFGYAAFRSATEYGPDGKPLAKKKGRPVGWRKSIHGSAAAQATPNGNGHTDPNKSKHQYQPSQPSSLRHVSTGGGEPIRIDSRSPSVAKRVPRYQLYKCKWQACPAELHNLETLKKHVFKVHRKETLRNTLECLWDDCGKEVTSFDPNTNIRLEKHMPHSFDLESSWKAHIQQRHFDPLSWELGDGPASGLSDAHGSEAYLSDAQGRQVTPRITVDHDRVERDGSSTQTSSSAPHRGRPPKNTQEREARDAQERLESQKRRIGGPGMDRGGATLVNDKRRRGFIDDDGAEEELVDAED